MAKSFSDVLRAGYGFPEPTIVLGAAMEGGTIHPEPKIRIPLATMSTWRHWRTCRA